MDPVATLAIIRDPANNLVDRLQAVLDLNDWLDRGGFLPADEHLSMRLEQVQRLQSLQFDLAAQLNTI